MFFLFHPKLVSLKYVRYLFAAAVFILISGCGLFFSSYSLTVKIEGPSGFKGGTVDVEPLRESYWDGTEVRLHAVASNGWEFESWEGVSSEDGDRSTILMNMHRTVTASFIPKLKCSNPTDNTMAPLSAAFSPSSGDTWTFMIYLDGDNNLYPCSIIDLYEIERGFAASNNSNMNIIVLYDKNSAGDTCLYQVVGDPSPGIDSIRLYPADAGELTMEEGVPVELNMGSPDVLADFITFCTNNYRADHYALVMWNHGDGARSINPGLLKPLKPLSKAVCADDNDGSGGIDVLFMDEVQQALVKAEEVGGPKLDLIGFDACLMGTVEAAYELRNHVGYYAASMNNEDSGGWDYNYLFSRMTAGSGGGSAEELGRLIVDSYKKTAPLSFYVPTMSVVKTDYMKQLKDSIDRLAAELYKSGSRDFIELIRDRTVHFFEDGNDEEEISFPYHDLGDLCYMIKNNENYVSKAASVAADGVLAELSSTVVSAYGGPGIGNYYGTGSEVKRGLSIFFSKGERQYKNASHYSYQFWYTDKDCSDIGFHGLLDFCTSDDDSVVESWRELHEAWFN